LQLSNPIKLVMSKGQDAPTESRGGHLSGAGISATLLHETLGL